MTNFYPDLPDAPYEKTSVSMDEVTDYVQNLSGYDPEVKRAAWIIFRIESANGFAGVNNNYCGMQADSGRWPESLTGYFSGVVTERENMTGRVRLFLSFSAWQDCVDCLLDRVEARGIYIGGTARPVSHLPVTNEGDLVRAYVKEWAQGAQNAEPDTEVFEAWFSMYAQAADLFA